MSGSTAEENDVLEWITVYSERHKRHYYYNTRTKESTWKKPKPKAKPGRKKKTKRSKSRNPNPNTPPNATSHSSSKGGEVEPEVELELEADKWRQRKKEAPVWTTHYDPKHKRNYYYNRITGKSTWTLPPMESEDVRVKEHEAFVKGSSEQVKTSASDGSELKPNLKSHKKEEESTTRFSDGASNANEVGDVGVAKDLNRERLEPGTPVDLIPSWRRYFNAKTVEDPSLPQPQQPPRQQQPPTQQPQAEPHPEPTPQAPLAENKPSHPFAAHAARASMIKPMDASTTPSPSSRLGVAKVEVPGGLPRKGLGLAFLSEIKSQKKKLQPGIKDNNTETSRASAPSGQMSFLDEMKTKLKARRESLEAEKMKDDLAALPKSKLREQDSGQDEARSEPNQGAWHRLKTAVMDVRKDREDAKAGLTQASIFQALLSKSREFHARSETSKDRASSTGTLEAEDWSSEEDVDAEMDSPSPSQAEAAWSPQFRVTSSGQFQIQCEGDDWKDFEQDTRLEELDIEEKSISEDSASALRANRAAIITDLSNTFKHAKTLQRFIIHDQKVR